jgi:glucosyl-3-phosphoglycerate synthase
VSEAAQTTRAEAALQAARAWARRNSFDASGFDVQRLLAAKGSATVAVIIPALEVETTIAGVVAPVSALAGRGLVDELVVVDGGSRDRTAEVASEAGATLLVEDDLMTEYGPALGKGDAMWRGLSATESEIVVFLDGDTADFDDRFVRGLVGPLLDHERLQLVKASYGRPFTAGRERIPDGGGRVSELVARPLLNQHFPELAVLRQPLSGELAARRETLEAIPFATGYGIEIQMLIDVLQLHSVDAIAQVEVGERVNQHQHVSSLGRMAMTIMRAVAARTGATVEPEAAFVQYVEGDLAAWTDVQIERPPLARLSGSLGPEPA